jgi:hypothetical protein
MESRLRRTVRFSAAEALGQSLDLIVPGRTAHWRGFDDAMANGVLKLQGRPTLTRALHKSGRKRVVTPTWIGAARGLEGAEPQAAVAARHVRNASSLRTRSVRREVR